MMSESVTVTVQDGNRPGATANKPAEPGQTNVFSNLRLNPLYFRTIPGLIKVVQLITPYIQPSPPNSQDKLLAVLDGNSTLRIYLEPDEASRDDDLERCEWLEEFAWREARHKHDFRRWQNEYLTKHPVAIQRKQERERAEAERKHREARERFLKIFGIICMGCGSPAYSSGHWFLLVAVTAFIITLIWVIVYLFSVREVLKLPINWILTELLNTAIYAILYFTAFVTELAWAHSAPYIVAGVFGVFNTLAYAAGTYFLYLEYKNNQQ